MLDSKKLIFGIFLICSAVFSSVIPAFAEDASEVSENSKIIKIEFEGNSLVPVSELRKSMSLQAGSTYNRDAVQENLKALYNTGYFTEKMKAVPIPSSSDGVILRIYLEENMPASGFSVTGNTVVSTGGILSILEPLEGMPQNINAVNEAASKIEDYYASKGYVLARVSNITADPDGWINIEIKEGTINSISFQGNTKTKDMIIERNILSRPGEVYNEETIKSDLMRLYSTQAFKEVNRSIKTSDNNPDAYDVTIELEEQRTANITLSGGLDTASGLFGQAGIVENNFMGNGQRVSLNLTAGTGVIMSDSSTLNHANLQGEISFFEPRLRGTDTSLLVRAFGRDLGSWQVPLAIERRLGGEVVLSRPIKKYKNLTGSFKIGAEYVNVKEGDEGQILNLFRQHAVPISERSRQLQGGTYLTLGPSLVYDTRDNALYPRNGVTANIRLSENINFSDFSYTHAVLTAGIKKYFPVMKKSSFSLSARAGGRIHGKMPEVMAFSMGGPYTVRGYRMSAIGTGESFMAASAELTTPFFFLDRIKKAEFLENIKFELFVDAGKVFRGTVTNRLYDRPEYGIAAGAGIKLYIPGAGALSIDYGIPLTNTHGSGRGGVFSFGAGDSF